MNHPIKIFPCNFCSGEGLVVVKRNEEDRDLHPDLLYIEVAFWQHGFNSKKWSWRTIIRACWYMIRHKVFWTDMVVMNPKVAKNFAYHILYLLEKDKRKNNKQKVLVEKIFS